MRTRRNSWSDTANQLINTYKIRNLGIGLLWSWIYCCWVVPSFSFSATNVNVGLDGSYIVSIVANICTLLFVPLLSRRQTLFEYSVVRYGSLLSICVGTLLTLFATPNTMAQYIGGFLAGAGSGLFWLFWAELYGLLDIETGEVTMPLSVLALPACCAASIILDDTASVVFTALLPIGSFFALEISFADAKNLHDAGVESISIPRTAASKIARKEFWQPFLTIGTIACIVHATIGVIWTLEPGGLSSIIPSNSTHAMLLSAISSACISILVIIFAKRPDIYTMYRWLLPTVVVSLVLLGEDNSVLIFFSAVLALTAQFGYTIALWTFFARVSHFGWATPAICMGMSHGFAQTGLFIGNITGHYAASQWDVSWICDCCICACVTSVLLLANRESIFGCPQSRQSEADSPHLLAISNNSKTDTTPTPKRSASALDEPTENRRLLKMSKDKGLTAREHEILALLVQGRSVPFIQEELFLSRNTVNTHVKHIYRKLNVHGKQELIDLYVSQQ